MTTDSDCVLGTPKSVLLEERAVQYFYAIDQALYHARDLSQYDRDAVWHVRQWQKAFDKRQPELASLSRRRAFDAIRACLKGDAS